MGPESTTQHPGGLKLDTVETLKVLCEDITLSYDFGLIGIRNSLTLSVLLFELFVYSKAISPLGHYSNTFGLGISEVRKLPRHVIMSSPLPRPLMCCLPAVCLSPRLPSLGLRLSFSGSHLVQQIDLAFRSVYFRVFPGAVGICLHSCKSLLHIRASRQLWKQQGRSF